MNDLPAVTNFELQQRQATALYKSGYFADAKSEAQAIAKVMAGAELGLPPFAAMTGINIIKGKPVLGANLIATLVSNHPRYEFTVKIATGEQCVIVWLRDGATVGESGFSMDEAKRAGLSVKDNWKKYPSDMLFARALTRGARRFTPGIFGGSPIYTPDELGAETDSEGYTVVESVASPVIEAQVEDEIVIEEAKPDIPLITDGQLKRLHALGKDYYGDDWKVKRAEIVHAVSKGAAESSGELTTNEAKKLIDGIEGLIAERDESDQPEMSIVSASEDFEQGFGAFGLGANT